MAAHSMSRWWWTMVVLPAMAVSACGGSRLPHDAIVAAVNGAPSASAAAMQELHPRQPAPLSAVSQNAPAQPLPGGSPGTGIAVASGASPIAPIAGGSGTNGGGSRAGGAPGGGAPAAGPAGPLAPILLGNVGTYSGAVGSSAAGDDTMVQVWAQWTNAHGGIAGHPVQVYIADDGGDPQRSVSLVRDMVENKHVIAFVGSQVPLTLQAQLPYLHQHNIPVVGGDNTTETWTSDSLLFPTGTTIGEVVLGDYKAAHQRGLTKLGLVYCIEAPACNFVHEYSVNGGAARAGENLVYQSQVTISQPDYTGQCLGAQSAGAQVIFLALDANSMARFAASCSRQNYHPTYLATAQQATNDLEGNQSLEGLLAAAQEFPWMVAGTPATSQFHQAVQEYAPGLRLSGGTAISWASGQLLAKAASLVGAQPTAQDILEGLWKMRSETLDGLTPPLTYAKNQPSPPVPCYFLIELKGGRFTAPSGDTYAC